MDDNVKIAIIENKYSLWLKMVRTFLLSLYFGMCQIVYAMSIPGQSYFLHLVAY